jgi:hypothetical protein
MRRVKAWRLQNLQDVLELTGSDSFILDMLSANIPHHVLDNVSTVDAHCQHATPYHG